MNKSKRKYQKPVALDAEFHEALERFAGVDPSEVSAEVAKDAAEQRLRLVEEEDTGHRFLIYATERGIEVRLRYEGGKFWMTATQMAQLFERDLSGITRHIEAVFAEGELPEEGNLQKTQETPSAKGGRPPTLYSLDMVISVAYRVTNSKQATMLRIWSTDKLVQILTKGFYIDKERLKDPEQPDIVDELRDTIREIRASTQNVYREVRAICAMCQDYDPKSNDAIDFFAAMENKLLWVATSMTGGEIIMERADVSKPDMGLTSHTGKRGVPTQRDVETANSYLFKPEATTKNRATTMLLDYFEEQLDQGRLVTMAEAERKLNEFIKFNNWPLLTHKGSVKGDVARDHAKRLLKEYKAKLLN